MKNTTYIWVMVLSLLLLGCDKKNNQAAPTLGFTKIIGNTDFLGTFYPFDLKETPDKGLITLSSTNPTGLKNIHLTKLSPTGELEWELFDSSGFVNPLPVLFEQNGTFYIFGMQEVTLVGHLLQIDLENQRLIDFKSYPGFLFPTSAAEVPGGYLVSCFDRDSERVRVMKLNEGFEQEWQESYRVFEDPVAFDEHLNLDRPLPFFCGHVGTASGARAYFVGSMLNQTLTTSFLNPTDGSVLKRISGFRYEAGMSNLLHLQDDLFFGVKYNSAGQNSILPDLRIDLSNGDLLNSQREEDIPDRIDFQFNQRTRTVLKKMVIENKSVVAFLSGTKPQETLIRFYSNQGTLLANRLLGTTSPLLAGNLTATSDGGLAVLCSTLIAGRISKLAVIKLSRDEVNQLF